jgi:hypothetical protein
MITDPYKRVSSVMIPLAICGTKRDYTTFIQGLQGIRSGIFLGHCLPGEKHYNRHRKEIARKISPP